MIAGPFHPAPDIRRSRPRLGRSAVLGALGAVTAAVVTGCSPEIPDTTGMSVDSAFVAGVVPVLRDQCDACHFEGGEMYYRMPFDDPGQVLALQDALLSRLEGKGRRHVAAWLERARSEAQSSVPGTEPDLSGGADTPASGAGADGSAGSDGSD